MKLSLVLAALAGVAGCTGLDTETTTQEVVTTVPALVNATSTFTGAVTTAVRDTAAARGITLTSSVATGYTPRNTVGVATAGASQVFLVGTSFDHDTSKAGLYQMKRTTAGMMLYRFDPTGGVILVGPMPPPPPPSAELGSISWMCGNAPSGFHDFCTDFCLCAMYDIGCPN